MLPAYASANLGIAEAAPRLGNAAFNLQRLPADAMIESGMGQTMIPWQLLQNFMGAIRGNYGGTTVGTSKGKNVGFGFTAEMK